jgi:hypothetical protein
VADSGNYIAETDESNNLASANVPPSPADLDRDWDVDGADLKRFASDLAAGTNKIDPSEFAAGFGR